MPISERSKLRHDSKLKPGGKVSGVFQAGARRGGYLVPDVAGVPDVRIPPRATSTALHGDHVQVRITRAKLGRQVKGEIVRILRHANKRIIGRIVHAGSYAVVHPKNQKIRRVVEIHRRLDPDEVPDGAWVVVEVRQWSASPHEPLIGKLAEVIGVDDDKGLPILLLIRTAGVDLEFPKAVRKEADALLKAEAAATRDHEPERLDLRGKRVFTIDPATAKDFDDAIHLVERLPKGWRIGVHIADVSHYVRPGTALDREAYSRSTSIYPVDRVIPMLPEALSNHLCSLRPGEDRPTLSIFFNVGSSGQVTHVEFHQSRIHSVRRFAYEEVQGLFDAADEEAGIEVDLPQHPRPRPIVAEALRADLLELRQAGRALNRSRMRRGALDLDMPEPEVHFDAEGAVIDLRYAERFEAHRLIEELMIAANEAVAHRLERRGFPLLFRVHDEPQEDKLAVIAPVLGRLGVPVPSRGGMTREQLQTALAQARRHPAGVVIQRWVLRAMMRAKYQPENIGHYGLASEAYAHFTSPIRRYPDLVVHRVVKATLFGERPDDESMIELAGELPDWGRHASQREELSQRIEWDAEEICGLMFMRRYLGDVFDGFISGVAGSGFFVALKDYPVEGYVRIAELDDDYYDLDETSLVWRGRGSGRQYALGDAVTVMIQRVDVLAGRMDLALLRQGKRPQPTPAGRPERRRRTKGRR